MDPRAGGEVRVRERSCARTECSEGAQGSGRLGSVESRLSRGMGLAFGERAVALLAMVGRFAAMPRRRHRDLVLGRVQRRGPASQPAGQLRGVDGDGGHPDVPSSGRAQLRGVDGGGGRPDVLRGGDSCSGRRERVVMLGARCCVQTERGVGFLGTSKPAD